MDVKVLTHSNQEYLFEDESITVRTNGLLFDALDGDLFIPWSNIKLVSTDSDDEDAVREFFYNF